MVGEQTRRRTRSSKASRRNRDPNFLSSEELPENEWRLNQTQPFPFFQCIWTQFFNGFALKSTLLLLYSMFRFSILTPRLLLRFRLMSSAAPEGEALHVDVHGCQDPPNTPAHLTVGLGAMCFRAMDLGDAAALRRAVAFGRQLRRELSGTLRSARLPGTAQVAVIAPEGAEAPKFSGAWRHMDRHTQSQQAVSFAGFSHAVQLEISKAGSW